MLRDLIIHNFGLIDKLALSLVKGLNVLTGETGAGKSIITGALRFALGQRLNSSQIRDNSKPCVVEAVYDLYGSTLLNEPLISDLMPEDETTLIIHRSASADGKTKIKINGYTLTVSQLKALGELLTDFHGPHDHQLLLGPANHLILLDKLAQNVHLAPYRHKYNELTALENKLSILNKNSENRHREVDSLTFQVNELESVPLNKDIYDDYFSLQKRLANIETLYSCASSINSVFDADEFCITPLLMKASSLLLSMTRMDDANQRTLEKLNTVQELCGEITSDISSYCDTLNFDPEKAQEINDTCDRYNSLKRKYGNSFDELYSYYTLAKEKLNILLDFDENNEKLQNLIKQTKEQAHDLAEKVNSCRVKTAKMLESSIKKELTDLGIKNIRFECRISSVELNEDGSDKAVFFISPNAGEELKPLAEIVSSGEAARVMLAFKKVLTDVDPVPVLVFDEIDAQIGGRLGLIIGRKLTAISEKRQVILITHLPQIASFADKHYKVEKISSAKRTEITIKELSGKAQITELKDMAGGEDFTRELDQDTLLKV